VDIVTGPDGAIYIADMYRGIIEGAQWAKEGTYLRAKIRQHGLDKVVNGHGRIWRLVHDDRAPDRTRPRMLDERPAALVAHLSHPNGWWRDMAQRLIVLSQDRSVAPSLARLLRSSKDPLARLHAMWTLEGLGALEAATVRDLFRDRDPGLRIGAIRASETLYKAGERGLAADYRTLVADADPDVAIQALLTLNTLNVPDTEALVKTLLTRQQGRGVEFVANRVVNPPGGGRGGGSGGLSAEQRAALERGSTVYQQLCFTCHGEDGTGTPAPGGAAGMTVAPSLAGSPRVNGHRNYVVQAILHGLTGPIDGQSYSQVMIPLAQNTDEWIADVSSFVRNSFGNAGGFVTPADVARVRAATGTRSAPWTVEELERAVPRPLVPDERWRVTASHDGQPAARSANAAGGYNFQVSAAGALSYLGWTTGVPQEPGMWLQIELPEPARLAEVQFTSSSVGGGRGVPATSTHPRAYRLQVSMDGTTWSAPVAEGQGAPGVTTITFAPVTARFLRLMQTADVPDAPPWSMRLLRLFVVQDRP
jgi:mono/diheme cytochrome c family protein